jgi:hypothetical protein
MSQTTLFASLLFLAIGIGVTHAACSASQTAALKADADNLGGAVVNCAKAQCGSANPSAACTALEADVLGCVSGAATGNPAVCLAGMPSLVSVGIADVTCVLADLASASAAASAAVKAAPVSATVAAAKVLASQRVIVKKAP